jgi:hypothetical protein
MAYRAYIEIATRKGSVQIATRKGSNFSSDSQRSETIPDETLVCDFPQRVRLTHGQRIKHYLSD